MYYYKTDDEYVIKYDVKINDEMLKRLRLEIIENCSHIIHKCYNTTKTPGYFDFEHIRNYKEKFLRWIEYNDFYSSPEEEYEVEYDYYEHDELVNYIDLLLSGDTSSIDLIINLKDKKIDKEDNLLLRQSEIINKLNNLDNKDIKNELKKLNDIQNELENYKKEKKLNKKQISSINYKENVLDCISLIELGRLKIEDINKVYMFFNNDKIIKKILKK